MPSIVSPFVGRCLRFAVLLFSAVQLTFGVTPIFQVTTFTSAQYPSGFVGTIGTTPAWPIQMGWQGDTIDVGFLISDAPPPTARNYRFKIVIATQFNQSFDLAIHAGSSQEELIPVHSEFIDTPRVFAATIPLERFVPGQTNWVRIQGNGVELGEGKPPGIQWNLWTLSRTDASMDAQEIIDDQLQRFSEYLEAAIQPNGMVRDSLTLAPETPPYHPASPDAAGFALLALCGLDQLGVITDAEAKVNSIVSAYSGHTPGVTPSRNEKGHWWHWLNLSSGEQEPGWVDNYTSIGSALLVSGALFAANHFPDNTTLAARAEEMRTTCDFDTMIHPALDGRVALATDAAGSAVGYTQPWNEYMLVVSMALRQSGAVRAPAISNLWVNPSIAPKALYRTIPTLTDRAGNFAPAFWVHQQYFFNPDFARNAEFVSLFHSHRRADALYSIFVVRTPYRYGLTAGVSVSGYRADRLFDHDNVFSPSAVGAWGDIDTLMEFSNDQPPGDDPRSRYGLSRVSSVDPEWWPADAGLVDHLFLLFGLVEARSPDFFKQRQMFQTPTSPTLQIYQGTLGEVTISWDSNLPGLTLQEAADPATLEWINSPNGTSSPVTRNASDAAMYFRLFQP